MKNNSNILSLVMDYFLVLSAIIGVGFASGKEIYVFFFNFGGGSFIGLIAFGLLYVYLFFIIEYIRKKLKLNSYDEFNSAIFGKLCKFSNVIMLINFVITSAGMLSGADYLFSTFFGINYRIPSLVLTIFTFVLLVGGIEKIKLFANIVIPIMIAVIVINSIKNINISNVNLPIVQKNSLIALYYGLLFGVNNFVAAMPVLFETKLKTKGKFCVILTICLIILFNILVLASNNFITEMPMFELSKNLNKSFYFIYFFTLILALFCTLIICSYNTQKIVCKNNKSLFATACIVIFNAILSSVGYANIVKYLYVVSGVFSGVYILFLIIMIVIKLIKHKSDFSLKNKEEIK